MMEVVENQLSSYVANDEIVAKLSSWGIKTFTDVQKKALAAGVLTGASAVVSAPTSSGKTLIAELAALGAVLKGKRVLYLVSHKALADQKYIDFEQRFGAQSATPLASVALSTGDRSEGDVDAQIRVATYEKAIGLLMAGQVTPENTLVVADELQIICDPTRGPDIEALCAIFRQRKVDQFIALTATVQNPKDLADWMGATLVESSERGTPLHQEIWYGTEVYANVFGDKATTKTVNTCSKRDLSSVVAHLIDKGLSPVLVFSETKKEAANWAADFIRTRPRSALGISISDQLELFSEPTDASEKLRASAERCVAFHTADLSSQERQVLEVGFTKSQFEVCFATSTLAAGVNFPFRSIVFPKLSFQYRLPGAKLGRSDYRNMSGRAGRLGLHPDGRAILLPKGQLEFLHAQDLVGPKNEKLESVLLKLSIRKTLLSLISSQIANTLDAIDHFFENTLYWFQVVQKNIASQAALKSRSRDAVQWLIENHLAEQEGHELRITQFGRAASISGLLPETAVSFFKILDKSRLELESDFDAHLDALVYICCGCGEFSSKVPSRFLPYVDQHAFGGLDFWSGRKMLVSLDRANQQLLQCAHAISLYTTGLPERKIAFATGLTAGVIQHLAFDIAWILEGLQRIASVPDLLLPQTVSNQIGQLSRRVRWGVPADTLDILRIAERDRVPGVGRQRAMELVKQGFATFQHVVSAGKEKLLEVLKSSLRVDALLASANNTKSHTGLTLANSHKGIADGLGLSDIIDSCYNSNGVAYEKAVAALIGTSEHIRCTVIDDGVRPNVPDLLLKAGDLEVLMECKTSNKLVTKEDAWAVLQKGADFAAHPRRVTLGKPAFDESAKRKAPATKDVTLVENEPFIEAILRLLLKEITSEQFMSWLMEPGVAELERLPGRYTFQLR